MPTDLPIPIREFLADFVARRRRLALAKAAALAVSAGLAILLFACMADRIFHLPRGVRGVLLIANLAAVGLILRKPVQDAMRANADWIEAAGQVESIEPAFAQRLITVTSQLQSPASHRGSAGMLAALVAEVSTSASQRRGASLLDWRWIKRSLTIAGCFVAITLAAMVIPWLQLPQLVARFTRPWADIAVVTSTHLEVLPGSTSAPQGKPLHVTVTAGDLGDAPVQLHVQQADGWVVSTLNPTTDLSHYAGDLPPLDRDSHYYITGGDAQSDTYAVHVLTSPGLAELRARVKYPVYLKWPEKSLVVTDGKLEVPAGSELTLSFVATEPLDDATLASPAFAAMASEGKTGSKLPPTWPTSATVDPTVRTATFTVSRDLTAAITLRSTQGVEQAIAQPLAIKAIPDRPPIVRLLTTTEDLRLGPTDLLTTAGQAMDDYGIEQLFLQVQVNDRKPVYQPITFTGDARRIEMPITCDLAALDVQVGDLLQLTLLAKDGAGQQRGSDVLRVIVSPRSFDLNAYLRLAELKAAKKMADDLVASLQTAREQVGQPPDSVLKDGDKTLQSLAASAQTAQLIALPLMRAASRSDRVELADSIAAWADTAEQTRSTCEELQDERSRGIEPGRLAGPMDLALDRQRRTANQLGDAVRQCYAIALRDEATAANEVDKRAEKATGGDRDRLHAVASRLRTNLQAEAQAANMNPADAEAIVGQTTGSLQSNRPIDFVGPANEWSQRLQTAGTGKLIETRSAMELISLPSRLAMASQVEQVRPDADFGRARDASLAARAGQSLTTIGIAIDVPAAVKADLGEYPNALRALQAEHAMRREKTPPGNAADITNQAQVAREKMRKWAGESDPTVASANADDSRLALEAAAAQQAGKLDQAKAIDQARAASAKPSDSAAKQALRKKSQQEIDRDTAAAQRLEMLRQRQQQLAQQTAEAIKHAQAAGEEKTAGEQQLQSLARQQQALAKAIETERAEQQDEADGRDPTDAAGVAKSAADRERADEQADAAQHAMASHHIEKSGESDKPSDEQQAKSNDPAAVIAETRKSLGALQQANDAMRKSPDDASKSEQAKQLDSSAVEVANQKLANLSPAADDAHQQIDDKVLGGVRQVQQDGRGHDPALAQHANDLDNAVREAMKKLDAAEEKLADHDALAAAEAAAKDAGEQLKDAGPAEQQEQDAQQNQQAAAHPPTNASNAAAQHAAASDPHVSPSAANPSQAASHPPGTPSANATPPGGTPGPSTRSPESQAEAARNAQQAQVRTLSALELAVDRANGSGGQARVRETPLIDSIFSLLPILIDGSGSDGGGADRPTVDLPSAREWGRLRPLDEQAQTAVTPATDPPGYEQSLKLYFETLGKKSE